MPFATTIKASKDHLVFHFYQFVLLYYYFVQKYGSSAGSLLSHVVY